MTDAEIEAAALADMDAQPLTDEELAQMVRGGAPRVEAIRVRLGMSREAFASAFGIPLHSIESWEEGREIPDRIACTLLRIIERAPRLVREAAVR